MVKQLRTSEDLCLCLLADINILVFSKNLLHMIYLLFLEAASNPRTDESKKFNRKQLILRNLHPDTTEKEVRDFVSQLADKSPSTIKFHHDNTAAMAGFQENIGKFEIFFGKYQLFTTLFSNIIKKF